jgi:hypothetical protein
MSEYFTVEMERTDDADTMQLITNQTLERDGEEFYASPQAGEIGSPLAQTIFFAVEGVRALRISGDSLYVTREPTVPWEAIIDDVRDALRDFFL